MAEFCQAFNMSPTDYRALTMSEYMAFIKVFRKEIDSR